MTEAPKATKLQPSTSRSGRFRHIEDRDVSATEKMPIGVFTSIGTGLGASLDAVREMGVTTVQLHSPPAPLRAPEQAQKVAQQFRDAGIEITLVFCGYPGDSYESIAIVRETVGLVPRNMRDQRVQLTWEMADFASAVGAPGIGMHVGFVSEDHRSREFAELVDVMKGICEYCKALDLRVHLETGQESAETLCEFIRRVGRDNLGVNFDPANMILYGSGNPIEALNKAAAYVWSCHCKDGVGSSQPGVEWGEEVPLGEGEVNIRLFLETLVQIGYDGPLTIEREISGEQQARDIKKAIELLRCLKQEMGLTG